MAFNMFALRRLYNQKNIGRGQPGTETRIRLHTTVTGPTFYALGQQVPVQKGGYAAPVVELSLRTILYLAGSLRLETVGEELSQAMLSDRDGVAKHLRELADFVENYQ